MDFLEITKQRYATKKFDGKIIPENKMTQLYEMMRLTPSSFGLQPWKIKVITDQKVKDSLLEASHNQVQVTTCSHLLVLCANTDLNELIELYEKMLVENGVDVEKARTRAEYVNSSLSKKNKQELFAWAKNQVFILLGNALNGAKSLGFDSCPMEGFSSEEYSKILKLPEHLKPVLVVPVGYAADEPRKKMRFTKQDVFF